MYSTPKVLLIRMLIRESRGHSCLPLRTAPKWMVQRVEQSKPWLRGSVPLCMLRFSIPAHALTFNHQIMLSFYQRQLQHTVAFRAVFFTKQEFETRKEVYSEVVFFFFFNL